MANVIYEWTVDTGRIYTDTEVVLTLLLTNAGQEPVPCAALALELPIGTSGSALTNQADSINAVSGQPSWDIRLVGSWEGSGENWALFEMRPTDEPGLLQPGTISFIFTLKVNQEPGTAVLYLGVKTEPPDTREFPMGKRTPPTIALTAHAERGKLPTGERCRLTWTSTNAEYCTLEGASDLPIPAKLEANGSWEVKPSRSTDYVLKAWVCAKLPPVAVSLPVQVGQPPAIAEFRARTHGSGPPDLYATVSWSVSGDDITCWLTYPRDGCSNTDQVSPSGSLEADYPASYTLRVTGAFGQVDRTIRYP